MENRLLHTPEGVRDIYGDEMLKKRFLMEKLESLVSSFGFREIETPTFEYFDVFNREIGTTPSKEVYKFFDSENNTLALRPDLTPGVARAAVKYFMEEGLPIRLYYLGHSFSNRSGLQGKLKEVTELGVEYMGEASVYADAEIVDLAVELLKMAGLKEFQICIGTAEYYKGLCAAAGLKRDAESVLSHHIRNKNLFGTAELIKEMGLDSRIGDALSSLPMLFGEVDILDKALGLIEGIDRPVAAIERLKKLYELLKIYGIEDYVTFDLGLLSRHQYYSGMVLRAYTFGTGEAIIRGGRYDHLLESFGKAGPAVGFTVVIDQLMNILTRQSIPIDMQLNRVLLCFEEEYFAKALTEASKLRSSGAQVEMMKIDRGMDPDAIRKHAIEVNAEKLLRLTGDGLETQLLTQ